MSIIMSSMPDEKHRALHTIKSFRGRYGSFSAAAGDAVDRALEAGCTWREIADALQISREEMAKRYGTERLRQAPRAGGGARVAARGRRAQLASRGQPRLLDIKEVACRLNVSVKTVRNLVAIRGLPVIKVGHLLRFDPLDLEDFIRLHRRDMRG